MLDLQWARLQLCDDNSTVSYCAILLYHTAAGNLLTVSRTLHLNRQQAQARRLHEEGTIFYPHESTGRLHRCLHAVADAQTEQPRDVTPRRHITARNQLVAGIFLHQTRKREQVTCSATFSAKLATACLRWEPAGLVSGGVLSNRNFQCHPRYRALTPWQTDCARCAGESDVFGLDPAFNSDSRLYRPDAEHRKWQYFNSSDGSADLAASGVPYTFFPRHAAGYSSGFPIVFPVRNHVILLLR